MSIRGLIRKWRVRPPKVRDVNILDVAAYFIGRSEMEERRLRPLRTGWSSADQTYRASYPHDVDYLKLQSLVFLAEACSLGIHGKSLFDDEIQKVGSGPFIRTIYCYYRAYFSMRISCKKACEERLFTEEQLALLDSVWEQFGHRDYGWLQSVIRRGLPFRKAESSNRIFSRELMQKYYGQLLKVGKNKKVSNV